jgi:hypothetical protein
VDVVARLNLTDIASTTRIDIIVERDRFGDEFESIRPREVNYPFRLVTCQIVFGELSAKTIVPGNVDKRLNRSWSENTLGRPRLSRTTIGIFFDQTVDAGVIVGLCVVVFSVASVFTGDESDKTSL